MTLLIFQMAIVLVISLACGRLARLLGQARVIGEIVGGILIGPSVLGRVAPDVSARLFPASSLGLLEALSTVGLVLFLFLIGSELDYEHLRQRKATATLSSFMSILLPFGMAVIAAPLLRERFSPNGVGRLPFTLFLGVSMSITAFPVLARILEERRMQSSPLGVSALMCAAVDDVVAWMLLALAMTLLPSGSSATPYLYRLLWLAGYLFVMLLVIRPLGIWVAKRHARITFSYELLGLILALVLASAAATDAIGVHPLFGAFLAGLCFPRVKAWQTALRTRLDVIVSLMLLPLFFALTGMRTRLDLLNDGRIWLWTLFVLLLAVVGKMGGAILAARWTGQGWRDSMALGALLNTRGLVEMIVLNIAYNAHVFSPTLFTMLVVMALITTGMTVPILNWLKIGTAKTTTQDLALVSAR
jgi:Kef-type K+ transport system membrane component KefB